MSGAVGAVGAVECHGAPRDQGLDQGRACREAVRRELRRVRAGRGGALAVLSRAHPAARYAEPVAREVRRHFPQVGERLEGLARGAGVSRRALFRRLAMELGAPAGGPVAGAPLVGVTPERSGGEVLIAGALDPPRSPPAPVLRRTHHDPGHLALDATLPALPAALAGVNAAGLAVAVAVAPGSAGGAAPAAPAAVLVQECLQRFETAPRALEWCGKRPIGGCAALVVADAEGELLGLAFSHGRRARLAADEGLLAVGVRAGELRERSRGGGRLDVEGLAELLVKSGATGPVAWLDPQRRRMALQPAGGRPHFVTV